MEQRDVDIVREEVRQAVAYLRAQFPDLQDDERAWMDTLEARAEAYLREIEAKTTSVEEEQDAAKEVNTYAAA
jgi:hypothetical protein